MPHRKSNTIFNYTIGTHFDLPTTNDVSTKWLECLIIVLRHNNQSFHLNSNYPILDPPNPNLDPPNSNLGPLLSNLTLLVGLSHACFETLEP